MTAEVVVTHDGDMITATVGRSASLSVSAGIAPAKLVARRDAARADLSGVESDDGYSRQIRSLASKVTEAQCVAILRFLGITEDAPDATAVAYARDYAERLAGPHYVGTVRNVGGRILASLVSATRDEAFSLLAEAESAEKNYRGAQWICPAHSAACAAADKVVFAAAAAERQRVAELRDHSGTD